MVGQLQAGHVHPQLPGSAVDRSMQPQPQITDGAYIDPTSQPHGLDLHTSPVEKHRVLTHQASRPPWLMP